MSFHPCLQIDTNAFLENYKVCQHAAPFSQIAAVIKNNGYGLGAEVLAQKLYQGATCRSFFVAYASEGASLRPGLPEANIYLLNGFTPSDLPLIQKNHLTPVLSSLSQIKEWEKAGFSEIRPALQVETGLNRLGVSYQEAAALYSKTREQFSLIVSHLADADNPTSVYNQKQLQNFNAFQKLFPTAAFSLSASDGMWIAPAFHQDMIRAGAFLYGLKTCPAMASQQKNVVSLSVSILQQKSLKIGEQLGYNLTFTANRPTLLAALSIGYGDGLFRSLSNKGCAWFQSEDKWFKAPFVGRISMDITMCDITDVPAQALAAQTAFLLNDFYTLDDMGKEAGTIGYEILSSLGRGQRTRHEYI